MVSTRPPTSKSSRLFKNPLITVARTPIGIIVTSMFHSFFQFSSKVDVIILLFTFFQFYSVISWDSKVENFANSLFFFFLFFFLLLLLLIIIRSGLLVEIRWSVRMSKFHRSLCESFSRTGAGLCIYYYYYFTLLRFFHTSVSRRFPSRI